MAVLNGFISNVLVYVAILLLMTGCVQLVLCNFFIIIVISIVIIILCELSYYNTLLPGKCSSRLTLSIIYNIIGGPQSNTGGPILLIL